MAKLSSKELAAQYGWALATLNSNKELKSLFKRAVKKQFTPERFIAELRNTKWFKSKSEAQRKFIVLKTSDPAQYASQVKSIMQSLADQYSKATGQVLPFKPPKVGKDGQIVDGQGFLYRAAVDSLRLGLNDAQINDLLFKSVNWQARIKSDTLGGTLGGQLSQLRQAAAALGVRPSDKWYAAQVDKLADGNDTIDGALSRLQKLAAQRYAAVADRIEAGETLDEITESYKQSLTRVLEVPSADVFNKHIQKALTWKDENGQPALMSINDFEDMLRRDAQWQYTQNAKETLLSSGQNLLKSFGLVA